MRFLAALLTDAKRRGGWFGTPLVARPRSFAFRSEGTPRTSRRALKLLDQATILRRTTTRREPWKSTTNTQRTSHLVRGVRVEILHTTHVRSQVFRCSNSETSGPMFSWALSGECGRGCRALRTCFRGSDAGVTARKISCRVLFSWKRAHQRQHDAKCCLHRYHEPEST